MATARIGGTAINYEMHGEGEALLLIMGLGSDLAGWMFQIPDLSARYRVVAFDNRGVGRSDAPDESYSIEMMAADAAGVMEAAGIASAHVLGISMGGFIAQELALGRPGRVKSVVLAATGTHIDARGRYLLDLWTRMVGGGAGSGARTSGGSGGTGGSARGTGGGSGASGTGGARGTGSELYIRETLPWLFSGALFEKERMIAGMIKMRLSYPYPQPAFAYARQAAACLAFDSRGRVGAIEAPTLVLVGDGDMVFPVELSRELAGAIPGAELCVIEGAGHAVSIEKPEEFNAAVLDFLVRHGGS